MAKVLRAAEKRSECYIEAKVGSSRHQNLPLISVELKSPFRARERL